MAGEFKPMSWEELQRRMDEDKIIQRDWKLLEKAQDPEKTNIKKAISTYERFVSVKARYPLPYLRLPVIYRKQKAYVDEVRVLEIAIFVFERENDLRNLEEARRRLVKAQQLLTKSMA